jgi:uncharacterized membrane protein
MKGLFILVALIISFLWGLSPVLHKMVLKNVNPIAVFILSGLIYSATLFVFTCSQTEMLTKEVAKLDMRDLAIIAFASIIDAFFANYLYYHILKDHESYIISALIFSSPIFTLLLSYFVLKEKITLMGALGLFFILVGIGFISVNAYKNEEFVTYL